MHLNNISIICVGIQGSANLGSIARVMKNFSFTRLFLVNPRCNIDSNSFKMACHARDVLENVEIFSTIEDLFPHFNILIGTTGKINLVNNGPTLKPFEVAPLINSQKEDTKIGIVFGPEDHGLSNQELKLCRWLIQIPTSKEYPSMNISSAVAIVLYEIRRNNFPVNQEKFSPANINEIEAFYEQLKEMLLDVGFLHVDNPERVMYPLRRIFGRNGLNKREVTILRGIVRQVRWALEQANLKLRR